MLADTANTREAAGGGDNAEEVQNAMTKESEDLRTMIQEAAKYNKQLNMEARSRAHAAHRDWIAKSRAAAAATAYDSEADAEGETDDELPAMHEKTDISLASTEQKGFDSKDQLAAHPVHHKPKACATTPVVKRKETFEQFDDGYAFEERDEDESEEEVEYVPRPTRSRNPRKPANV